MYIFDINVLFGVVIDNLKIYIRVRKTWFSPMFGKPGSQD